MRRWSWAALAAALVLGARAVGEGEPAGTGWTLDLDKMKTPDARAEGMLHGDAFRPERAVLHKGVLTLRQGKDFFPDRDVSVFLFKDGERVEGKTFRVGPEDKAPRPHAHLRWKAGGDKLPHSECFAEGYALLLSFGKPKGDKVDGKIYLCFPDENKSFVAGTFVAEVR
jgi:hypothetical protein